MVRRAHDSIFDTMETWLWQCDLYGNRSWARQLHVAELWTYSCIGRLVIIKFPLTWQKKIKITSNRAYPSIFRDDNVLDALCVNCEILSEIIAVFPGAPQAVLHNQPQVLKVMQVEAQCCLSLWPSCTRELGQPYPHQSSIWFNKTPWNYIQLEFNQNSDVIV